VPAAAEPQDHAATRALVSSPARGVPVRAGDQASVTPTSGTRHIAGATVFCRLATTTG